MTRRHRVRLSLASNIHSIGWGEIHTRFISSVRFCFADPCAHVKHFISANVSGRVIVPRQEPAIIFAHFRISHLEAMLYMQARTMIDTAGRSSKSMFEIEMLYRNE